MSKQHDSDKGRHQKGTSGEDWARKGNGDRPKRPETESGRENQRGNGDRGEIRKK